jgi:hypothetical protein
MKRSLIFSFLILFIVGQSYSTDGYDLGFFCKNVKSSEDQSKCFGEIMIIMFALMVSSILGPVIIHKVRMLLLRFDQGSMVEDEDYDEEDVADFQTELKDLLDVFKHIISDKDMLEYVVNYDGKDFFDDFTGTYPEYFISDRGARFLKKSIDELNNLLKKQDVDILDVQSFTAAQKVDLLKKLFSKEGEGDTLFEEFVSRLVEPASDVRIKDIVSIIRKAAIDSSLVQEFNEGLNDINLARELAVVSEGLIDGARQLYTDTVVDGLVDKFYSSNRASLGSITRSDLQDYLINDLSQNRIPPNTDASLVDMAKSIKKFFEQVDKANLIDKLKRQADTSELISQVRADEQELSQGDPITLTEQELQQLEQQMGAISEGETEQGHVFIAEKGVDSGDRFIVEDGDSSSGKVSEPKVEFEGV